MLVSILFRLRNVENEDRSKSFREKRAHLDPLGAAILIAAVCCLLLALQWGGTKYAWDSARIICLFVFLGLLLMVFCLLQWKLGEKGTIPPRILRQRTVLVGCLYSFMLSMANYTVIFEIAIAARQATRLTRICRMATTFHFTFKRHKVYRPRKAV